jgi:hypothetical protein
MTTLSSVREHPELRLDSYDTRTTTFARPQRRDPPPPTNHITDSGEARGAQPPDPSTGRADRRS